MTAHAHGPHEEVAARLAAEIDQLLSELDAQQELYAADIAAVADEHQVGARNIVDYAYLRTLNLGPLQEGLSSLGATRLSTAEPNVRARLKAARNVLGAISGTGFSYPYADVADAFQQADALLEEHTEEVLGIANDGEHSRIMVTLPSELADDPAMARQFVAEGMDIARINCAHDDEDVWARMIAHVKAAAAEAGADIKISMDLAGPKLRTGDIVPGPRVARARLSRDASGNVIEPARLWLYPDTAPSSPPSGLAGHPPVAIAVAPSWFQRLSVGDKVRFRDTRGRARSFDVVELSPAGVLAAGQRAAYIAEGTLLDNGAQLSEAGGIAPVERRLRIFPGQEIILSGSVSAADPDAPGPLRIPFSLPEVIPAIRPGEQVLFDDGRIGAEVIATSDDEVRMRVNHASAQGTNLAAHKGINLPNSQLPLPSLTQVDLKHLEFVKKYADIVAISFIRDAQDVAAVLEALGPQCELGLVLKIETIPAYNQLLSVLLAGMRYPRLGIMIARGDLAVELGFRRMAEVPRFIMRMAEAAHIPTILATQVLETMAKTGQPSRAEITDAAYALRAECVMLNKGPFIGEAIRVLNYLNNHLGVAERKNRVLLRKVRSWAEAAGADSGAAKTP